MIGFKDLTPLINIFSVPPIPDDKVKRYFFLFCAFLLIVATLEFAQDFIDSLLNKSHFQPFESLSYKLFWLLFIPLSIAVRFGFVKIREQSAWVFFALSIALVLLFSIVHLVIFSSLLVAFSKLIHSEAWKLSWLLTEKFSTRLYIALSVYIVLTAINIRNIRKETQRKSEKQEYSKTILVKIGKRTILVNVDHIKWVRSDGPYLFLHTVDDKYLITGSLKNIITTLPENFKRIHRSTIVNTDMIFELRSRLNGDYDVIMNDGNHLRLSRNYTKPLKGTIL